MVAPQPTPMAACDTLFTFNEAMQYLRVSRATLNRMIWRGELPGHKVGYTYRFTLADLRACVEVASHEKQGTSLSNANS